MINRVRAVVALAAGAAIWAATTAASVTAGAPRRPTFANDIAPLIYAHCTPCHRPGQPGPFPLLSYDDVRAKGADIAKSTASRAMPPWRATQGPRFPALLDDRRLTDRQIKTIGTWVADGMPAGNLHDAPQPPGFDSSPWPLGLPDVTLTLPRVIVTPAGGSDEYRNVVVPLDFPADVALSGIDYLPDERSVLRHARFFAAPADLAMGDEDPLPGVGGLLGSGSLEHYGDQLLHAAAVLLDLGAWTPGSARRLLPSGLALRVPAHDAVVIQMHLHPGDVDAIEDGRLAIYFSKPAARRVIEPVSVPPAFGIAAGLSVPAGEAAFSFTDAFTLPIDVEAVGARGDAQRLGHDMTLTATLATGATRGLLRIGAWDADWPDTYFFATPVRLPKGTRLKSEIVFDNSAANPRNIFSPPRRVVWGRMSSGEMAALVLLIVSPSPTDAAIFNAAIAQHLRDQLLKK